MSTPNQAERPALNKQEPANRSDVAGSLQRMGRPHRVNQEEQELIDAGILSNPSPDELRRRLEEARAFEANYEIVPHEARDHPAFAMIAGVARECDTTFNVSDFADGDFIWQKDNHKHFAFTGKAASFFEALLEKRKSLMVSG